MAVLGVHRGGARVTYYLTEVIKKSFGAATARRQPKYAHSVALKSSPPKLPPACRRGKNRIKRKRGKKAKRKNRRRKRIYNKNCQSQLLEEPSKDDTMIMPSIITAKRRHHNNSNNNNNARDELWEKPSRERSALGIHTHTHDTYNNNKNSGNNNFGNNGNCRRFLSPSSASSLASLCDAFAINTK